MAEIDLMLDEENELTFQLNIEGSRPAEAECRLILDNHDMSLSFNARKFSDGEVSVVLPPLKHVLKEGVYNMELEVIVDDRYFKPLSLKGNFEKSIKVTAESIARPKRKKASASASLVEVSKPTRKEAPRPRKAENNVQRRPTTQTRKKVVSEKRKTEISDREILSIIRQLSEKK
jgi:hypothetical protein